jgi:hypothetical protein
MRAGGVVLINPGGDLSSRRLERVEGFVVVEEFSAQAAVEAFDLAGRGG